MLRFEVLDWLPTPSAPPLPYPIATRRFRVGWRSVWDCLTRKSPNRKPRDCFCFSLSSKIKRRRENHEATLSPPLVFDSFQTKTQTKRERDMAKQKVNFQLREEKGNKIMSPCFPDLSSCIEIHPTRNQRQPATSFSLSISWEYQSEMFCFIHLYSPHSLSRYIFIYV